MSDQQRRKSRAAGLSVASNTLLVILKAVVGFLSGSVSVLSEAIHSAVDLVAALIAFVAVRVSGKPADREHPFGHGKVENISGVIEALLIFVAGVWIILEATRKLLDPEPLELPAMGLAVMAISAVANLLISAHLFRVGKETDSVALIADGWHLRTDVWTSTGVAVGLGVISLGRWLRPEWTLDWIDPVVALIVAVIILHAAYDLTRKASRDLIDASLPDEEEDLIRRHILKEPQARGFHHLRTRKAGDQRFIEFHLMVDGQMSVTDAHEITDRMKEWIEEHYPRCTITIHVEPCVDGCPEHCVAGCTLSEEQRHALFSSGE